MGEIDVRGPQALDLVQHVTVNDASKLKLGQAQYSALLYGHGGFVDDILVHKVADEHYFLCVNASNQDKDYEHIVANNRFDATVENAGPRFAQLAIQGPLATGVVQKLTDINLAPVKRYHFVDGHFCRSARAHRPHRLHRRRRLGNLCRARTRRAPVERNPRRPGTSAGIIPCGLGARNTLRMESAMPLYGHEIHASITPWEAGLDWIVKLDKGDFLGREALVKQKQQGITRKLAGFEVKGRGIARDGYEILAGGVGSGWVTSGGPRPH